MAWFPIAAAVVSTVVSYMGNKQAASAAKQAGERQQQLNQFQADQMNVQAGQEIAASQRAAADQRRQANLIASRAVAVAGASGGGVSDPTVQNLIGDIQGEGAYRSALKLYQGEDSARQLRMGAEGKTFEGGLAMGDANARASAYTTKGYGSLVSGGMTLYEKYAQGGSGAGGSKSAQTGNGWMDAGSSGSGSFG